MSSILISEPVVIEDDDTDMEPVEIIAEGRFQENKSTKELIEIEIDLFEEDSFSKNTINTNGIIEPNQNQAKMNNVEYAFVNALRNNTILNKIVNYCSKAPNNIGMERVIKKSLLPLYKDVHNELKESTTLTDMLKKTLRNLKHDPNHKFLYMKRLCEQLKTGHFKRKPPTLTNQVRKSKRNLEKASKRKKKKTRPENPDAPLKTYGIIFNTEKLFPEEPVDDDEVVILDKSDEEIISIDDDETDAVDIEVCEEIDNNSNKENSLDSNDNITITNKEPKLPDKISQDQDIKETDNVEVSQGVTVESQEMHLVPTNQVEYKEDDKSKTIKNLEEIIARHKTIIATLEEQEVNDDNESSPYITCARLKREVVEMYKEVCELTNHDLILVKRREVRLKVRPGHPPGPAQRLELFLNNSIDDRGMVAFPDFQDVVTCVTDSNKIDQLNWSKQQITTEALALFKQCGQALRKQRQKREYRDLMSLVRNKLPEEVSEDPADHDPELLAKLERNKRIALSKEEQLLDRYTSMHHSNISSDLISNSTTSQALENPNNLQTYEETTNTSMDNLKTNVTHQFVIGESSKRNDLSIQNKNETIRTTLICVRNGKISIGPPERKTSILHSESKLDPQSNDGDGMREKTAEHETIITKIAQVDNVPALVKEIMPASVKNEVESIENDIAPVKNEPAFLENELVRRISTSFNPTNSANQVEIDIDSSANNAAQDSNELVSIKIENTTTDLQSKLDNLGDTYTCSVYDIEDPFLVIEISSDESSSDEL